LSISHKPAFTSPSEDYKSIYGIGLNQKPATFL
jgi:hypothetical protein